MTSSYYANLKIINWDFIKGISTRDLRLKKDPKIIQKLIVNFLNSHALFSDPSFCPAELVNKYFQLLQISVSVMVSHIHDLKQEIDDQNNEIKQLKNEKEKRNSKVPKYILPPVVFQCVFCSKLFKTRTYLNNHIKRRHPERNYPITQDQPPNNEPEIRHIVKTATNVPEVSQDLGPFKDEANAMLDHFDTILKNEQICLRSDFMEQFHRIDNMIQEILRKVHEERMNSTRRTREMDDASYSDPEAQEERLKASDNSTSTHIYSEHENLDNEDSYSYHEYSLNEGEIKQSTQNTKKSESSTSAPAATETGTLKSGSPSQEVPAAPPQIEAVSSTTSYSTSQTTPATAATPTYDSYHQNYEYYDYYEYSDEG